MSFTGTAKELSKAVEEFQSSREDYDYYEIWAELYSERKSVEVPGVGVLEQVESRGGDGDGATMWLVFKVDDRLFEVTGTYSSWDSNYWDTFPYEVVPYVEPKVFYRRK